MSRFSFIFRKAFVCLSVALTFWVGSILGQGKEINSEYFVNHVSKKPESGSLGSFGNTSINYYRGLPEVSIDLLSLSGRETSLPVTLNYDASGVRTDELSGAVGLKWSLNAGGFVQREINGLPDEHALGYWKFAKETNYYTNIQPTDWAQWCERNDKDYAPDQFIINIPGRTIRFVFDKDKNILAIPRQNVKISFLSERKYYSSNGKEEERLTKFELILEDGTRYVFGGTDLFVEERKIESLTVGSRFNFKTQSDCPDASPLLIEQGSNDIVKDCQSSFHRTFHSQANLNTRSHGFFNHKWLLQSIIYPGGDQVNFSYQRLANVVYALRPSSVFIGPLVINNPKYIYDKEECADLLCLSKIKQRYIFYNILATQKYPKTDPGSGFVPKEYIVYEPPVLDPKEMFDVIKYSPTPGAVNFYHTLITESNTKLVEIKTVNGNRVTFTSSVRVDLPNSVKYDVISLYNMNNTLVKALKLNYTVADANEENDFFWFSEALLMLEFKSLKETLQQYKANYVKKHLASDIPNGVLAKYVFEGLKEYNYKRTFLQSIEDITNQAVPISLYSFTYTDLHLLRRRTTTLHDINGYHRSNSYPEYFQFGSNKTAVLSNSFSPSQNLKEHRVPRTGLIKTIQYPTGGKTNFYFDTSFSPMLTRIEDVDFDGAMVRQREMEYSTFIPNPPIYVGYQDFRVEDTMDWMKYMITSSAPLNDSYSYTHGVPSANYIAIVYHGTKQNNNGFEKFVYLSNGDITTPISSIPSEGNLDGSPLINIFPYPKRTERDYLRALLSSHAVYKKGAPVTQPLKQVDYTYRFNPPGYTPVVIKAFKGGSFNWTTKSSTSFWNGYEVDAQRRYRYANYEIRQEWVVLEKTVETIYDENDFSRKTSTVTDFVYDPVYLQPIETKRYISAQPEVKYITKTRYATDANYAYMRTDCQTRYNSCTSYCYYSGGSTTCYNSCTSEYQSCLNDQGTPETAAIQQLRKTNQHLLPVEIQSWVEENGIPRLTSSIVFTYQTVGTSKVVRKKQVFALNNTLTASQYVPSRVNSMGGFEIDPKHRAAHSYDSYDPSNNMLLSQTSLNGVRSQYVWAHGGSLLSENVINPGPEEHRTRYTHLPLIGMTSVADPNGVRESYAYDNNKRLLHVRDEQDRIKTRYRYHYISEEIYGTLTASIKVEGQLFQNQTLLFTTPIESREYGTISYEWDFGDGVVRTTTSPSYSYAYSQPGTYRVNLRKSHSEFGSSSASIVITIRTSLTGTICVDGYRVIDIAPTYLSPIAGDCSTLPIDPNKTILRANSSGGCGTLSYQWQWLSNGVWTTYSTSGPTAPPPSGFVNRVLGTYSVRCIVRDACGNQVVSGQKDLGII